MRILLGLTVCAYMLHAAVAVVGQAARPMEFPLPPGVAWAPNPALPPGGQLAVLVGSLQATGLYAARVGFAPGLRVMPHWHPEERLYTVLSGTWLIGLGDRFDESQLTAFPVGTVYRLPAATRHYHWARDGASVVQITGIGPSATNYVNPQDDPRIPAR